MSFLLVCGFKDIKDSKLGDKKYALILTDMVIVTKDGVEVTTNDSEKKLDDINFAIDI
jgi:nucleosome binding factor SPN SPT16 subunit